MSHTSAVVTFLGSNAARVASKTCRSSASGVCQNQHCRIDRRPGRPGASNRRGKEGVQRAVIGGGGGTSSTTSGSETHMGNSGQTLFCVGVHKRQRSMLNSAT